MKRLVVTTRADVTIEERWTVDVPDEFDPDEDDGIDVLDRAMAAGSFIHCEDRSLENERDRETVGWEQC